MVFGKLRPLFFGKKQNAFSEHRVFERVECALRGEFYLEELSSWIPMDVLDLNVAGMKARFNPVFRNNRLREDRFDWTDSRFRFFLKGEFFILAGHFLKIYSRKKGLFTVGVEFDDPTPEVQFKLAALYGCSVRRN